MDVGQSFFYGFCFGIVGKGVVDLCDRIVEYLYYFVEFGIGYEWVFQYQNFGLGVGFVQYVFQVVKVCFQ